MNTFRLKKEFIEKYIFKKENIAVTLIILLHSVSKR